MMSTSAVPLAGPSPGACSIHVRERGQRLALVGCLDVHTAADVRLALVEAVALGSGELVVDLSAINAVDA
ncbi:MAG: hypothetical protein JWL64_1564, partial [Frankiales bacterium]|nr:hypothetical protein [Frankiales bacterium]